MKGNDNNIIWSSVGCAIFFVAMVVVPSIYAIVPDLNRKERKNVVVGKDEKRDALFMQDVQDNKKRTYVYNPSNRNLFNFVQEGDTLVLEIPRDVYLMKYKSGNNVIFQPEYDEFGDPWYRSEAICLDYNDVINWRVREDKRKKYEEQKRIQELARYEQERQQAVIDSLRDAFVGLGRVGRARAERNILQNGDSRQQKALTVIKDEDRQAYVADSIQRAQELAEKQRIKKEHEQAVKHEREKKRIIKQHKKNGTLWQYIAEQNVTLIDTVRIVRIYTDKRLEVGGGANYSSDYSYYSEPGRGGGILLGGVGIGGGRSGSSHFNGGADGSARIGANYEEKCSAVAKDRYGYTYTFPVDPMLQLKCGDRMLIEYMGRQHTNVGYFDRVKMLNVLYQR